MTHYTSMSVEEVVVGVVPRDRFSMFSRSLEALYANTEVPFRVILTAGGADLRTMRYLRKFEDLKGKCTVVLSDQFLTQGQARNLALKQVKERFFVVLENDTIVHKNWLRPLLDCMQEEGAAVVAPLLLEDGKIHAAGGEFEERTEGGVVNFRHPVNYAGMDISSARLRRARIAYPETHCMLIDRHLLPEDDLFDEVEPFDADLGLTLRKRGLMAMFEPRSVATYVPPPSLKVCDVAAFKFRWDADAWAARNREFMQKWSFAYDGSRKQLFYRRQHRKLGLAQWYPNALTVWVANAFFGFLRRLRRIRSLGSKIFRLRGDRVSSTWV